VQVRSVRVRVRMWAKFLKFLRGGFKFCGCGAGADTKFQPAQDSSELLMFYGHKTIAFKHSRARSLLSQVEVTNMN